jgi:UDP-3-O-[3-hydroxymyristoyl] glucosamine N-acyltransferase
MSIAHLNIPLAEIAELVQGKIRGDDQIEISGVAPFEDASGQDISLAGEARFLKRIGESKAGALIVPVTCDAVDGNLVLVENPRAAFAKVMAHFHPQAEPGDAVSDKANIGEHVCMGGNVQIGPFACIGNHVTIGHRVIVHAGVFLGDGVTVGDDVVMEPNVVIMERCFIGNRTVIHAGTVIGTDGYGFAPQDEQYLKIPQIGNVVIGDDVEIGANNTIDRATFGSTRIGNGVKTDNLVHVAHNVIIDDHTLLIAQVGVAGSVTIGKHTILAGQVAVAPQVTIGDHVMVGPQSGIAKSIPDNQVVMGTPGMPHKTFLKVQRIIQNLPDLRKRLLRLEKKLKQLDHLQKS